MKSVHWFGCIVEIACHENEPDPEQDRLNLLSTLTIKKSFQMSTKTMLVFGKL
jgi:hypothetical protein